MKKSKTAKTKKTAGKAAVKEKGGTAAGTRGKQDPGDKSKRKNTGSASPSASVSGPAAAAKPEAGLKSESKSFSISMNMLIAAGSLILFLVIAGFASFFIITDRVLVRAPMLVQVNPKVTFIVGEAHFRENESREWQPAVVGQNLKNGWEVRTDAQARIDIRFHEGTAVRINENSHMVIDHLTISKMNIHLIKGDMYGRFNRLFRDHDMRVRTPTAVAAIRGTELGFSVKEEIPDFEDGDTGVEAGEGEKRKPVLSKITTVFSLTGITEVFNPVFSDQRVLLSYQNRVVIDPGSPPANPEKLTAEEVLEIQAILNSIHHDEVLLITDKITFSLGSAEIVPSSYPELERIKAILDKQRVKVRIEGHTDSLGEASFNQTLSEKRAESIKNYLVDKGLDLRLFETAGFGETKPIASNRTSEGRALNRRVEFLIIE